MSEYSKRYYLENKEKRYDICSCGNKKLKNSPMCRKCSLKSPARNSKISNSLKGHPMYKSKSRSKKLSIALKGKTTWMKGKKHTKESKEKNSLSHIKEDSLAPLIKKIRWNSKYKSWKNNILDRDNNICCKCGEKNSILEVHHINPINEILKEHSIDDINVAIKCPELWDENNGISLCVPCHAKEDKYRNLPQRDLILGAGEIGVSLHNILKKEYNVLIADKNTDLSKIGQIRYLHICFPYSKHFINNIKRYKKTLRPLRVICHSTVPIGTNRKIGSISSPCVGIHPHLEESFITFTKFLGGEDASQVSDYFRRAGIKVYLVDKQESTEYMKIMSTTFYGMMIEFTKQVKQDCRDRGIPFELFTLWNMNYNTGYEKLGYPEYKKPLLVPNMTPIKGHCIMPNTSLLDNDFTNFLKMRNQNE